MLVSYFIIIHFYFDFLIAHFDFEYAARGGMDFGFDSTTTAPRSVDPLKSAEIPEKAVPKEGGQKASRNVSKRDRSTADVGPADPKAKRAKSSSAPRDKETVPKEKAKVPGAGKGLMKLSASGEAVLATPPAKTGALIITSPPRKDKAGSSSQGSRTRKENLGLIWGENIQPNYPDSLGIFLPGYQDMRKADKRPAEFGQYSREVFRAVEPPFVLQQLKENPSGAIETAMGHIMEIGTMMGRLKDDLDSRDGKLKVPEVTAAHVAAAVQDRDFWKDKATRFEKDMGIQKREITSLKKEVEENTRLLDQSGQALLGKDKEIAELVRELNVS